MKLSREELLTATTAQLAVLGVHRAFNKGWLTRARLKEWTQEQIERFRANAPRKAPQWELFDTTALKTEKPLKYRDDAPELFANRVYEEADRDLS